MMHRPCLACGRVFDPGEFPARQGRKSYWGWEGYCSTWCGAGRSTDLFDFNGNVKGYVILRGQVVLNATVRDGRSLYWHGHDFMPEASIVKAVNEYLDVVNRSWFYTDDELHQVTESLMALASKLRYGDKHAWT